MTHPELIDGATYIEVLMLSHLDERARALAIGQAMLTPLLAADADLDATQRLRFWVTLTAYLLGVAEAETGADGRNAIVQTLRNVPACAQLTAQGTVQ